MAKSSLSISIFFTLLCLWSSTAAEDLTDHIKNLRQDVLAQNEVLHDLQQVLSSVQRELKSKAGKSTIAFLKQELEDLKQQLPDCKTNGSRNIEHTTICGGVITVKNEYEIRYHVPSQQDRNENYPKWCIWIVENSHHQNFILNLTDSERVQDLQLWTISNFTAGSPSTSQKIKLLRTRYSIPESYFVLYFRINSTSSNSFKLNIRSNIFESVAKYEVTKSEKTVHSTSNSSNFTYPGLSSTLYSANERTFIILKPIESGSRMTLRMESLQTESNADWVEITTFSGRPISRERFSGVLASQQNFTSGIDEPILVFFGSDSLVQYKGFSCNYTEETKQTKTLTNENQNTCGGLVSVLFEKEISYQVPPNSASLFCIWTVKNELAGRLQVELVNKNQWTIDNSAELFIIDSMDGNSTQKPLINIRDSSTPSSFEVDSYFLLYFRFNPNLQNEKQNNSSPQEFRLLLKDNSAESPANNLIISHTELTPSSKLSEKKEFLYPVGSSHYSDNERAFIIIKPTVHGSKIKIGMADFEFKENDYVQFSSLSYSKENKTMTFESSFSGTFLEPRPRTLKGRVDEPVILFFSSDGSGVSKGFKFTYSAINGTL